MITNFGHHNSLPGVNLPNVQEVVANGSIVWGRLDHMHFYPGVIDGSSVDPGNVSHTGHLRPGLILGRQDGVTGKWKPFDIDATDGTQYPAGILLTGQRTDGRDRFMGWILVGGFIRAGGITIADSQTQGIVGHELEQYVRKYLGARFIFDDLIAPNREVVSPLTDDITLTAKDSGSRFLVSGNTAKVVTLPEPIQGVTYKFNVVGGTGSLKIEGVGATDLIVFNNAGAKSVTLGTASEIIGGSFEVIGLDGKWLIVPNLWEAQTVTVA